jgi:hypothetical protein
MQRIWEAACFVRKLRIRLRFGKLSRAPLKLLRLELRGNSAECEWMARPADPWDSFLPAGDGERNASLQALQDAMAVRELLFATLPDLQTATFRVYRESQEETSELIITGTLESNCEVASNVRSPAMRAKLFGFQFWMENGVLGALQSEEYAVTS